jgi:hypothetical protein
MRKIRQVGALLFALAVPMRAQAQPCPASIQNLAESATIAVTDQAKTCSAPDQSYVKVNAIYKLHVSASDAGTCQTYVRNGVTGLCDASTLYNRDAWSAHQDITGNATGYTVSAFNHVQSYDTCGNGNCTSINTFSNGSSWFPASAGQYTYTGNHTVGGGSSGSGSQYCNMTATYAAQNQIQLYAVACAPQFNTDQWDNIINAAAASSGSPNVVSVYIPTALAGTDIDSAAQAAVTAWNTQLSGYSVGLSLSVVYSPCSGAACINVSVGTPGGPAGACASIALPTNSGSGGELTSASSLVVSSGWTHTWYTNGFLTRTMSHELEHALGLKENTCSSSDSLMGTFSSCGQSMSTTTPTTTDQLPFAKTVYGTGTRLSCGF